MSKFRFLKYILVYSLPLLAFLSFYSYGLLTYAPILYAFVFIPLVELFFKPDKSNLTSAEEEMVNNDRSYDFMVYLIVPVLFILGYHFCITITDPSLETYEVIGRITGMGMLLGTLGINVGHELGHRKEAYERFMAKLLLLSSFYMHFYIEHNRGHHKNVSTPEDPASSRLGEVIWLFWFRSIFFSYFSAWNLEKERLQKAGKSFFSVNNQMIQFTIIQLAFACLIAIIFSPTVLVYYFIAAIIGILLLETVNYIEHYGLQRNKVGADRYERVMPHHSWNSNHPVGRLMLFELSRHSDHHYIASRKYQVLKDFDDAPPMPTGYPGMMVLALIPPIWFAVMHPHMKKLGLFSE
jgi:alkane 1-monooxygenase